MRRIFVISDSPRLSTRNTLCFDVRTISHQNRKMVLASDNKEILRYVKDAKDDYCITEIPQSTLHSYCRANRADIVVVSNCRCDIKTKDVVCHLEEIYFEEEDVVVAVAGA